MVKYLFIFLITACATQAFAQLKKSKVVIYGDNEAAWAAAVQSARSGVNTLWLRQQKGFGTSFKDTQRISIESTDGLDAGLWAEFLSKTRGKIAPIDSISVLAKQDINTQIARNVFEGIADSLENLHQLFGVEIKSINKTGKQWQIELSSYGKLKVTAVVDASDDGSLLSMIKKEGLNLLYHSPVPPIAVESLYSSTLFRTGLFIFGDQDTSKVVPALTVLKNPAENFFVLNLFPWLSNENNELIHAVPLFIQSGQVIGASAAYCAFFKTTTDKINIRTLQGELLAYHGQLVPFQDIKIEDPNFSAIQRIAATGILKGRLNQANDFEFNPENSVSSREIEPVILDLYTRSQIWFNDKNIKELALSDVLSLIKFTALKGEELDKDVKNGWKQRFHFSEDFNPGACITRRQLAVLVDYYLKPFNVKIDSAGKFKY